MRISLHLYGPNPAIFQTVWDAIKPLVTVDASPVDLVTVAASLLSSSSHKELEVRVDDVNSDASTSLASSSSSSSQVQVQLLEDMKSL